MTRQQSVTNGGAGDAFCGILHSITQLPIRPLVCLAAGEASGVPTGGLN